MFAEYWDAIEGALVASFMKYERMGTFTHETTRYLSRNVCRIVRKTHQILLVPLEDTFIYRDRRPNICSVIFELTFSR